MKSAKKNRLLWMIPVLTTVCSILYIGMAVKQEKTISIEQNENLKEIAFFKNVIH